MWLSSQVTAVKGSNVRLASILSGGWYVMVGFEAADADYALSGHSNGRHILPFCE